MNAHMCLEALNSKARLEKQSFDKVWLAEIMKEHFLTALHLGKTKKLPHISSDAIREIFHIGETGLPDALDTFPLNWGLTLKEVNVTKAICHSLDHHNLEVKMARVNAFLHALNLGSPKPSDDVVIESEFSTENLLRFDIFIGWGKSKKRYEHAVICECKLDSPINSDQLTKYEEAAEKHIDQAQFVFLSRKYKPRDVDEICKTTANWTCRVWWRFLRDWEKSIRSVSNANLVERDDAMFRLLRSTLWDQIT